MPWPTLRSQFGIARVFLGLGESGNFPAAIKTVAEWFPQSERSLATGIFNSGTNVGAILAPLIVPWITIHYGWRAAFLATGLFSMLWIVWWWRNYRKPTDHPTLTGAELRHIYKEAAVQMGPSVPWMRLLGYRQTWAFAIAKFLTDPIWWFYLFWLPSYFSDKFHLNLSHLGLPLILIYNMSAVGSIGGGWLPAPFRRLGLSAVGARLTVMLVCACAVVPIFTLAHLRSEWAAIALLGLAAAAHQGWSANLFTTVSDMFPRSAVGAVVGIGGMAGAVGGALLAFFTGHILRPHAQLCHSLRYRRQRVPAGTRRRTSARAAPQKSRIHCMSLYVAKGSPDAEISDDELKSLLFQALDAIGPRRRVLAVPPDQTRIHSRAGELTRYAWQYYGEHLKAVLPALGTHAPMRPHQLTRMFGAIPQELFRVHNWRTDVETLGEVPAEFIRRAVGRQAPLPVARAGQPPHRRTAASISFSPSARSCRMK